MNRLNLNGEIETNILRQSQVLKLRSNFLCTLHLNIRFFLNSANLIMLGHGCVVGWFSPALPSFLSTETPLITSGPLTDTEVSWIGSITSVGAMCGSLTFGFFTTLFGCKRTMIFLALPTTIFWILVYFGDSYYYILIARYFTGYTGGGIQTTIVLFISEISNNK